jgi:bifunctional NMN adenylyltransferase/nudix hydrolase
MEVKKEMNPSDYQCGCIIGRFQVHKLHDGHIELINQVCKNHKKVIIFLGVPVISNTRSNPLDFASRKAMIQQLYPNVVVLPLQDTRSDKMWSNNIDKQIPITFGDVSTVLYGSRDSFIPYYLGKYPVIELVTDIFYSGTEVRKEVSSEILSTEDFRAGVIHATFAHRPVTYPTVDVVAYNDKRQILLCKKANESLYRFIGGFVDRDDNTYEKAAKREFKEETGGCEIDDLTYVCSSQINDWRYANTESGIMTTLFVGKFIYGHIMPSDDIFSLHWLDINTIDIEDIIIEHREIFDKFRTFFTR